MRGFLSSREVHIYVRMVEGTRTGPIKPAALFWFPQRPASPIVSYLWLTQVANPYPQGGIRKDEFH